MATKERTYGGRAEGDRKVAALDRPTAGLGIANDKISKDVPIRDINYANSAAMESTRRGPSLMSWRWVAVFLTRWLIEPRFASGKRYLRGNPSVVRS